jgi:hypothetical protein
MTIETNQKVTASQLKRSAFLYIRQSTARQVLEHTESTARQYALRKRAVALGWKDDQVIVIDSDLGHSAASAADREGFQKLVMEVSMGRAGIVLGLEVSRLARNSSDWHRLLEICAITDTLILDEDGIYHPAEFNDRLLLGLKGTMSEAELHLIRARTRGKIHRRSTLEEFRLSGYWGATEQKTRLRIQVTSTIEPDGLRSGRNWGMAMIRDRLGHITATQRLGSTQYPSGTIFALFAGRG